MNYVGKTWDKRGFDYRLWPELRECATATMVVATQKPLSTVYALRSLNLKTRKN